MCLRPRGQVADARTPLLKFKMEREILVFESSRLGRRIIPKLLAYNQGKIRLPGYLRLAAELEDGKIYGIYVRSELSTPHVFKH